MKRHKNDFIIRFAGEAGQGLVTSADAIARAAVIAGYHIQTFSTFPSQIMGGPASSQVHISTKPTLDNGDYLNVLVALNKEAYDLHAVDLTDDGIVLYNSADFQLSEDGPHLGLNADLIAKNVGNARAANMALIGAVAELIKFSTEHIHHYIRKKFTRGRLNDDAIISANIKAVSAGAQQARQSGLSAGMLAPSSPVEYKQIVITGNAAISLGAVAAGLQFYVGYPISPATTILVWMENNLLGEGKFTYQVASELEAINAVIGAGFAGKKAMTATAGPGFSLMSEGIGLAWMAEIPCVIVNVQRGGPSTGLPTKSEQSDLFSCMYPSHGDVRMPILAPGTVEECFYAAILAIGWAERYQGPVVLISEFSQSDRTQNIPAPDMDGIITEKRRIYKGENGYKRYASWEDNGKLSPMPIPGNPGAYVANGSEHDEIGDTTHFTKHHIRLTERRFRKLSLLNDGPYEIERAEAPIAIMPWGTSKGPAFKAYRTLLDEGMEDIGWIYSLALHPMQSCVLQALRNKRLVIVPELNYQGQWSALLRQEGIKAESITQYAGVPFRIVDLVAGIRKKVLETRKDMVKL